VQAEAGCDIIAPSDMMDGRVGAIRKAPALPAAEPGEHHKAMLLRLVEALVERASCISELLQTSSALAHHIGAQVKPLNRIFRAVCIGTRRKALRALLGEIAQRGLDRRPKFLLVGRGL